MTSEDAQKQVNFHQLRIGLFLAIMFAISGVSLGWWFNGYFNSIIQDYNQKFQQVRIENNERMDRIERALEKLTNNLDFLKKSSEQDTMDLRARSQGRWTRLHQFIHCERWADEKKKLAGMCAEILEMPMMILTDSSSTSWTPRYEMN